MVSFDDLLPVKVWPQHNKFTNVILARVVGDVSRGTKAISNYNFSYALLMFINDMWHINLSL